MSQEFLSKCKQFLQILRSVDKSCIVNMQKTCVHYLHVSSVAHHYFSFCLNFRTIWKYPAMKTRDMFKLYPQSLRFICFFQISFYMQFRLHLELQSWFACSTSLVYHNQLFLLKNSTLYLRDNFLQCFEHYSSSGVKMPPDGE